MTKVIGIGLLVFCMLNSVLVSRVFATEQIRYPSSKDDGSIIRDYVVGLLELILEKTQIKYGTMTVVGSIIMQQARSEIELQRGNLVDVVSFGTSIARENKLLAVKIPIYRGILGFRVSIIRKDFELEFSQVKTIEALKKYSACQGKHWPDSKILEAAGLNVVKNATYEGLFRQLVAKRCDYFPRSIQEGPSEIIAKRDQYPELMLYRHLIIHYPYSAYFFVNKNNTALHQRLTKGFNLAIQDGSFQRYLNSHIRTKDLFPISNWIDSPTIKLSNPLLSENTDVKNSHYWIIPKD